MATIEIIELENIDIANGDVCHMNYTVIYKADNVSNVNHNWNTISFDGKLNSVDGANSVCESGQCEQRRLEVGECVLYKNDDNNNNNNNNTYTQCSVLAAGADNKYTIAQFDYVGNTDAFSADLGSGVKQQYFKPRRTEIPNVSRVKLKTVNHVVKITDAATGKQTLYYTDFLDKTQLPSGKIVSKTVFINLDEQTYLPFWCEPTIGFVAVPNGNTQPIKQLAWTHYMDWCSDLHNYITNPVEACAAYMYTYVKVSPADVAAYCSQNAANINVEQEKILRVLGKMATNQGATVPNPPMSGNTVPNPPMIYMRRRLLTNQALYQIHSPDDTQLYVNAAREVTQSIINNQHFPFVCFIKTNDPQNKNDPQNTNDPRFDALESFDSWTQRKNRVGNKILVLTNDVTPLIKRGFTLSEKQGKYTIYTNNNNLKLYVANVFGVEACKNVLIQSNSWWEDKGFYYVNYGNNYNQFYGIKPFVDSDKKCGLDTNIMKGGDDNDDLQTGGVKESNSLCISTQEYKYILFDPTIDNEYDSLEWKRYNTTHEIVYDKFKLSGAVLKTMCDNAHQAILDKYNINNLSDTQIDEYISPKFTFIFIDKTEERLINIGIKKYIDNILKINETQLINNYEDFATNFIIVSPKQIQPNKKSRNETNYMNNFIVYWGYLNIKRMKLNKANTGVVFESPLPGSRPLDVPFDNFKATIAGGDRSDSDLSDGDGDMFGGAGSPKGASKSNTNSDNCSQRLKFDKIEDFEQFLRCLNSIDKKDYKNISNILPNALKYRDIVSIADILNNPKYNAMKYNIELLFAPLTSQNKNLINKNPIINNVEFDFTKSNLASLSLITMKSFVKKVIDKNEKKPYVPEPAPAPVQESSVPEDLSQQIHIQITFTVCQLNRNNSTDSTCYHKAYIKSVVPRSTNNSECSDVINNANNIYEATKALYAYKNKGYRLVKLCLARNTLTLKNTQKGL